MGKTVRVIVWRWQAERDTALDGTLNRVRKRRRRSALPAHSKWAHTTAG